MSSPPRAVSRPGLALVEAETEAGAIETPGTAETGAGEDGASGWGPIVDVPGGGHLAGDYVPPEYPAIARMKGQQGSVLVGVEIREGKVSQASVVGTSGFPLLDGAATKAILQWRFDAALDWRFVQRVTFRLE